MELPPLAEKRTLNPHAKLFIPARIADTGFNVSLQQYGVIRLELGTLLVNIAPSRAVKVWDKHWNMSAAVSSDAGAVAMNHPKCLMFQEESIKLAAFSDNRMVGCAYCSADSTILAQSYYSRCHDIADDGDHKLMDRTLRLDELLSKARDLVDALFERND